MPYTRPPRDPQTDAHDALFAAIEETFRRRPETTEADMQNALANAMQDVPEAAKSGRAAA